MLGPSPFAKHFASLHLFAHADARGEGRIEARAAPGFGQIARCARNLGYAKRYAQSGLKDVYALETIHKDSCMPAYARLRLRLCQADGDARRSQGCRDTP